MPRDRLRRPLLLLLIPAALAVRDSDVEEMGEEAVSGAEVQLAASRLLHHLRSHLEREVSGEEKELWRRSAVVGGLERHGISLEQQVEWFALAKLGLASGGYHRDVPASWPLDAEHEHGLNDLSRKRADMALQEVSVPARLKTFLEHTEGEVDVGEVEAYIRVSDTLRQLSEVREHPEHRPNAVTEPEAYRRELLAKYHADYKAWFAAMEVGTRDGRLKTRDLDLDLEQRTTYMDNVLDNLVEMQSKIGDMNQQITYRRDIVWSAVERVQEDRKANILAWVRRQMRGGKKELHRWGKLVTRVLKAFRWQAQKAEEQCNEEHLKKEQEAMQKQNMRSGEEMARLLTTDLSERGEKVLGEELAKSDRVLQNAEKLSLEREKELAQEALDLKRRGQQVVEDAARGDFSPEELDDLDDRMTKVVSTACDAKEWSLAQQLRGMFKRVEGLGDNLLPHIGYRGIGGAASVLGGGYEEVIDLWNKEIGVFTWGAAQVGFSSASASASGYSGLAWKGYKIDWNLEDAYKTSLFVSVGAGVPSPIPIAGASLAGVFALDADSGTEPWTLDNKGLNGVAIGWGLSLGLSVPLPVSVDVGKSTYQMFNAECFPSLASFIAGIWKPLCNNCTSGAERSLVGSVRSAIKVAAFPMLSDVVFSYLALRVDAVRRNPEKHGLELCPKGERDPTYPCIAGLHNPDMDEEQRCSHSSTKFRKNLPHMASLVASKMKQVLRSIQELERNFHALLEQVDEGAAANPEAYNSHEWSELVAFLKTNEVGCLSAPRETTMSLAPGRKLVHRPTEQLERKLKRLDVTELRQRCNSMPECKRRTLLGGKSKDKLAQKLASAYNAASDANPYGTCSQRSQCGDELKVCKCLDLKVSRLKKIKTLKKECPGSQGHCACGPGYCWAKGQGCREDTFNPMSTRPLILAFREWLLARHLELGSYAVSFQEILRGADLKK